MFEEEKYNLMSIYYVFMCCWLRRSSLSLVFYSNKSFNFIRPLHGLLTLSQLVFTLIGRSGGYVTTTSQAKAASKQLLLIRETERKGTLLC